MQEEKFKMNSFIGGWYINPKICDNIINYFEKSKRKAPGMVNSSNPQIDKNYKVSMDISLRANDSLLEDYNDELKLCVEKYMNRYIETKELYAPYSSIVENCNIQKYLAGEGFYKWHCERFNNSKRCLVFMTYLNDVDKGGTEFKYQKIITKAKKGLTLIWPSDFTHTHRGQIANQTKYILTGWFNFI